jgi:hypothetical protein
VRGHRQAEEQTERAQAQHENSDSTGPFQDPGAAARERAQTTLDDAKAQVEDAAKKAAGVLLKASEKAPPQPGPLTMLGSGIADIGQNVSEAYGDFWRGSYEGGLEMIQQVRAVTPFDPYNLTHPMQYAENMGNLVSGTVTAVKTFANDPGGTSKAMITAGIDSFTKDPFGTVGKLAPGVASGLTTGGGTALSKASSWAQKARELVTPNNHGNSTPSSHNPPPNPPPHTPPAPQPQPQPQAHNLPPHQPPTNTSTYSDRWDQPPNPNHSNPPQPPTGNWTDGNGSHTDYSRTPDHTTPDTARDAYREPSYPAQNHTAAPPQHFPPDPWGTHSPDDNKPFGPQGSDWTNKPTGHDTPDSDAGPRLSWGRGNSRAADDDQDWGDPWGDVEGGGTREIGEERPSRETPEQPDEHPDRQPDTQRQEDPAGQRDQDEATETEPRAPDPEPHGEPRHELPDEDRQSYRERVEARTGVPFEESVARLREEHPELAHLDDEKAMGVRRYIGEDANTLNRVLREGDAMDRAYVVPEANVLRSALDEMPKVDTADTPRVYRDIGVSDRDLPGLLERYKPGAEIEEPAFTSASKDIPPRHFAEHGEEKPRVVRFIIEDPRNARDLSVTNPDELEVMWQEGNRFLVQGVQQVGDEVHIYTRDLGR